MTEQQLLALLLLFADCRLTISTYDQQISLLKAEIVQLTEKVKELESNGT